MKHLSLLDSWDQNLARLFWGPQLYFIFRFITNAGEALVDPSQRADMQAEGLEMTGLKLSLQPGSIREFE